MLQLELHQNAAPCCLDHPQDKMAEMVAKYFDSKVFSDITIVCSDKKEIPAHRIILARSPVFAKIFTTEVAKKIVVEDIDSDTMKELLRFIYIGYAQNLDTLASQLLYAAEKYDLPELKSICATELIELLSLENVFASLVLADRYNEQSLLDECLKFINS
jgi:speckle-type POZ protein